MNRTINILFLGGARRTSFAERLILSGQKLNLNVNIFSYELTCDIPLITIAKEIIIGKRWNDPQLLEHLAQIIREKEIKILLPFVDPAVEILARFKKYANDEELFIPVSDVETARTFFDKKMAQE